MDVMTVGLLGFAMLLAAISMGGGLYEISVIDPVWPNRPDIIRQADGGISRKRFWIPAHVAFELSLLVSLCLAWSQPEVRLWVLISIASQAIMRIWSGFDFIPKALAFEKSDAFSYDQQFAEHWVVRSRWRLILDAITCVAVFMAFWTASQAG